MTVRNVGREVGDLLEEQYGFERSEFPGRYFRIEDAQLLGTPGRTVLSADDWSPELNDAFVEQLIEEGREVFLASPVQGNLIQEAGPFAGQPTIFARELELLEAAGYRPDGDFLLPPA